MRTPLYTIGHSNHKQDEFIHILLRYAIATLVDIRTYPASKRFPQFDSETLRESLQQNAIIYHWAGKQLGGMRKPHSSSKHTAIKEEGMRGFADYMQTDMFHKAVVQLINLSRLNPTVIMCAEGAPAQCHRSLLADYLTIHGIEVIHLVNDATLQAHQFSSMARRESAELIYDRNVTSPLI